MNIKRAKQEIKDSIEAYLQKDETGHYLIPSVRQRPILLMGPPGIGKTQIMEQIARECGIGLVSYTITHHTRQSAVGLPFIREKEYGGRMYSVTEYTMSEIIASVYEKMEETGLEEGILFLDEINCVSETLAPTMLQFLQCKMFGNHKIPDGWIIVAAGNPPEYNKSVREFDIVTLDRLKRMDIEENYDVWREYAYQAQIAPVILAYLEIRKGHFYRIENTVDGMQFVTARGWEDLSELLKAYERLGKRADREVVHQYLQNWEVAKEFANYLELYEKYKKDYGLEKIVAGVYSEDVFEKLSARPCHIYVNCGRLSAEQGGSGKAGSQPEQEKPVHDDTVCVTRQAELMMTRDILSVSLRHRADGRTYHFLVNHHPSKYGGAKASEGRRRIAMQRLRELCDSLYAAGGDVSGGAGAACDSVSGAMPRSGIVENRDVRIIAMGDFNDTPSRGPFDVLCGGDRQSETGVRNVSGADRCSIVPGRNAMVNLGSALEAEGEGTIRYGGKWELIDLFIVSQALAGKSSGLDGVERSRSRMEVARIPFLMTRDNTHVGDRPLRTYSGPRYIGGVSDHCPVILTIAPLADDF